MRNNARDILWEIVTVRGETMLFSDCRVDKATVPDDLYMYEVRHADDDWGDPCEIAEGVLVNFFGTLLSEKKLSLEKVVAGAKPCLGLDSQEDWGYEGVECLLEGFIQK